jgi:hypothetical protein
MSEELKNEIAKMIAEAVELEKEKLAKKVRHKLEYTGEFAKAKYIMDIFDEWESDY